MSLHKQRNNTFLFAPCSAFSNLPAPSAVAAADGGSNCSLTLFFYKGRTCLVLNFAFYHPTAEKSWSSVSAQSFNAWKTQPGII